MARNITQTYTIRDRGSADMRRASNNVSSELKRVESTSQSISQKVGAQWTRVAGIIAAAFSVRLFVNFTKDVIQVGDDIDKLSQSLGVSTEWLDKARQAANLGGSSMEAVGRSISYMANALGQAESPTSRQGLALKKLGLTIDAIKRSGPEKAFEQIAKALRGVEDPLERNEMLMALLGRSALELVPLLGDAASSWENFTSKMTPEKSKSMAEIGDILTRIKEGFFQWITDNSDLIEKTLAAIEKHLNKILIALTAIVALGFGKWLIGIGGVIAAFVGSTVVLTKSLGKVSANMEVVKFTTRQAAMAQAVFSGSSVAAAAAANPVTAKLGKLAAAWLAVKKVVLLAVGAMTLIKVGVIVGVIGLIVAAVYGLKRAWKAVSEAALQAVIDQGYTADQAENVLKITRLLNKKAAILKEIEHLRKLPNFSEGVDPAIDHNIQKLKELRDEIEKIKIAMGSMHRGIPPEITITPGAGTPPDPNAWMKEDIWKQDSDRTAALLAGGYAQPWGEDTSRQDKSIIDEFEKRKKLEEEARDRINRVSGGGGYAQPWGEDTSREDQLMMERLEKIKEMQDNALEESKNSFQAFNQFVSAQFASGILDGLDAMFDKTKSVGDAFRDMFASMARDLAKMALQKGFMQLLSMGAGASGGQAGWGAAVGKIFGFADGGRMKPGQPGIVGERGPELFIPPGGGTIIPNHALTRSNVINNFNVSVNNHSADEFEAKRTGRMIAAELNRSIDQRIMYQRKPGGMLNYGGT